MRRADPLRRLEAILTEEAAMIRRADFSQIDRLIADKSRLAGQIGRSRPAPGALERVRRLAERNAILLQAAMQGLRAAQARLSALTNAGAGLRTYDASGDARSVTGHAPSLERKA